jgi:CRISPR-associated endonuclease Cas2
MGTYIVTYDLNNERKARGVYEPIIKYVKDRTWARLSESSYAVNASETPQQIYDQLKRYLDSDDNLYVITLTNPYFGQGPKEVNDWLARNVH